MNFNEYQQTCLLTESPITDEVRLRYNECIVVIESILLGQNFGLADEVKKYIFYGKEPKTYARIVTTNSQGFPVRAALRTTNDSRIRLVHAFLGLVSEIPELAKAILGEDKVNIAEEFADIYWYNSIGLDAIGVKASDSASANLAKLKARFPDRFSQEKAVNRDLVNETAILKDHLPNV